MTFKVTCPRSPVVPSGKSVKLPLRSEVDAPESPAGTVMEPTVTFWVVTKSNVKLPLLGLIWNAKEPYWHPTHPGLINKGVEELTLSVKLS